MCLQPVRRSLFTLCDAAGLLAQRSASCFRKMSNCPFLLGRSGSLFNILSCSVALFRTGRETSYRAEPG
jgi:hypothetical protein